MANDTTTTNNTPATMAAFGDELSLLTLRLQGLGAALSGLAREYPGDTYVSGVQQMGLDLEQNAHRLEESFKVLLGKASS